MVPLYREAPEALRWVDECLRFTTSRAQRNSSPASLEAGCHFGQRIQAEELKWRAVSRKKKKRLQSICSISVSDAILYLLCKLLLRQSTWPLSGRQVGAPADFGERCGERHMKESRT